MATRPPSAHPLRVEATAGDTSGPRKPWDWPLGSVCAPPRRVAVTPSSHQNSLCDPASDGSTSPPRTLHILRVSPLKLPEKASANIPATSRSGPAAPSPLLPWPWGRFHGQVPEENPEPSGSWTMVWQRTQPSCVVTPAPEMPGGSVCVVLGDRDLGDPLHCAGR